MPANMEDIARECGVSVMTVSRVLNGRAYVKASTREKILQSAERLNFGVNVLAQNFVQKRSGFVGVVIPFERLLGSDYSREIFRGFQSVFATTPWDFALFDMFSPSFDSGHKLEKLFLSRKVDGLLVVAPNANPGFFDTLTSLGMPMVVTGKSVINPKVCSVSCDDYGGIQAVCSHLFDLGHRRIAFVGGPLDFSVAQQRERAYVDFCLSQNLEIPPEFVQRGNYSMDSGREAGLTLLRSQNRPTAIAAANDMMAFGVMESAQSLNVKIPTDISVTGFDNSTMAANQLFSLTTVHQPVFEMAEWSAKILLKALNDRVAPEGKESVPVSLIIRDSTGKIAIQQSNNQIVT